MPKPKKTIQQWRASPLHLTDGFMVSSDIYKRTDELATITSATSRPTIEMCHESAIGMSAFKPRDATSRPLHFELKGTGKSWLSHCPTTSQQARDSAVKRSLDCCQHAVFDVFGRAEFARP